MTAWLRKDSRRGSSWRWDGAGLSTHHSRAGRGLPPSTTCGYAKRMASLSAQGARCQDLELESEGLIRHTPAALRGHGNRLVEDKDKCRAALHKDSFKGAVSS